MKGAPKSPHHARGYVSMDRLTQARRSWLMSRVGAKDTKPELIVRRLLHRIGVRYRLHRKGLPGTPDIVLPGRKVVIFVHGCFWHGHECGKGRLPKSNEDYWRSKIQRNTSRDRSNQASLREMGWRVIVVWQCQLRDLRSLEDRMRAELILIPQVDAGIEGAIHLG